MFFLADDGFSYPFSRVKSTRRLWQAKQVEVMLDDDRAVTVPEHIWERRLRLQFQAVIPALPGYAVLCPVMGDDGDERFDKEPIVGWAISVAGELLAVTADGPNEENWAVLTPEGVVVEAGCGSWDNLGIFLAQKDSSLSERH